MTPNTETAYLLTQRIVEDLIPKYIESLRAIDLDSNFYDTYNNYFIDNIEIYLTMHFRIYDNKFECTFYKKTDRKIEIPIDDQRWAEITAQRERERFMLGGRLYNRFQNERGLLPRIETTREQVGEIKKTFRDKQSAINFISKQIDIDSLITIGLNLLQALEQLENVNSKHIGAIKKILGLSSNVDLINIQSRKILLEKS